MCCDCAITNPPLPLSSRADNKSHCEYHTLSGFCARDTNDHLIGLLRGPTAQFTSDTSSYLIYLMRVMSIAMARDEMSNSLFRSRKLLVSNVGMLVLIAIVVHC